MPITVNPDSTTRAAQRALEQALDRAEQARARLASVQQARASAAVVPGTTAQPEPPVRDAGVAAEDAERVRDAITARAGAAIAAQANQSTRRALALLQ
ncbi:MAG: hypothetical protein U0807_17935 [Candidatus Binatia bacterium]